MPLLQSDAVIPRNIFGCFVGSLAGRLHGSGFADSHGRRTAALRFLAVGMRVRGTRLPAKALARIYRCGPRVGDKGVPLSGTDQRRASKRSGKLGCSLLTPSNL